MPLQPLPSPRRATLLALFAVWLSASPSAPAAGDVAPGAAAPEDRAAVLVAIESYRLAMEARDLEALGKVFPSVVDEKAKGRQVAMSFELTRSLRLDVEVIDVSLDGDRAAVRCERHDRIELHNGQKFDNESGVLFHLRRGDGGWIIESIEEAEL